MQVWRVPEGSGLCNVSTNSTYFNVLGANQTLYFGRDLQEITGDLNSSYSQVGPYFLWERDANYARIQVNGNTPVLQFFTCENNYPQPYTTETHSDDSGFGYSRYTLYVRPGDIIFEESAAYPLYKNAVVMYLLVAVVGPLFFTRNLSLMATGLPLYVLSVGLILSMFDITGHVVLLVFIISGILACVAVWKSKKSGQLIGSYISMGVCATVGGLFLLACSPFCKFGLAVSVVYLFLTYCCIKPSRTDVDYPEELYKLHLNLIRENQIYMFFLLSTVFYLLDRSLPNFLNNLSNFTSLYPETPGIVILVGTFGVCPILCFGLGSLVFLYASRRVVDAPKPIVFGPTGQTDPQETQQDPRSG